MLDIKSKFNMSGHPMICRGFCIMLDSDDVIRYAGPLGGLGNADGMHLLLHPEDYDSLHRYMNMQEAKEKELH